MINILDFGAVGNGTALNTKAFEKAIAEAKKNCGTVYVPAGTYLTGTIDLQGVSLYLESGAVIKGSENLNDYPYQDFYHNELGQLRALIVNLKHDNVSITGSGTIDFNGHSFYDLEKWNVPQSKERFSDSQIHECTHLIGDRPAQSLFFFDSKNITISGISVIDAPCWTLTFAECENVKLTGLTIDTSLNIPNDDGIHISSCKDVIISDCNISSGDDCIALSCITNWEKPCENVVISNCILRSCSKAIVIGYIYSQVRNVMITNCIIKESNRGLCIMSHDECGTVENVRVSNCMIDTRIRAGNWWGNGEPILMMAVPHDSHLPSYQKPKTSAEYSIRNVHINSVTCTGENAMGIVGSSSNISDISLQNIDYKRKPSLNIGLKGFEFDLSPSDIVCSVNKDCGLFIKGAENIRIENVNTGKWSIVNEQES